MTFRPPSNEESEVVQRLRIEFENQTSSKLSETTYLRFYRGFREENTALKRLLRHRKWRIDNSVDNIEIELEKLQHPYDHKLLVIESEDTEHHPCGYIFVHRHDAYDRVLNEMTQLIIYFFETLLKKSRPDKERFVIIFDLSRFTLQCMDYEVINQFIFILSTNYPECVEKLYIVDAPFIFSACWPLIQAWIVDPSAASLVSFVSKTELLQVMNIETMPSFEDEENDEDEDEG